MPHGDSTATTAGHAESGRFDPNNAEKWTRTVLDAGFTVIPDVLIANQATLKISAPEMCVLLQLLRHWWFAGRLPFPSIRQLENALPMKRRAIQRAIAGLVEKGLIERRERNAGSGRRRSNVFEFSGLIERLKPLAAPMLASRRRFQNQEREEDGGGA